MPAVASGYITTLRVYLDAGSRASSVVVGSYNGDGKPTSFIARGTIDRAALAGKDTHTLKRGPKPTFG